MHSPASSLTDKKHYFVVVFFSSLNEKSIYASEKRRKFLRMYCPVKVGVRNPFHTTSGRRMNGRNVVARWRITSPNIQRVRDGKSASTPISISNRPKIIRKVWSDTKWCRKVTWSNWSTRSFALLTKIILRNPNHTYTRKSENRAIRNTSFLSFIHCEYSTF